MAYNPDTVLQRYQQMLDIPDGEPEESTCAMMRRTEGGGKCNAGLVENGQGNGVLHDTLGCEPGGCQSCCVGVVEVVRQYSERQASLETRSIEFDDILTKAGKLTKD